ncbi:MAG: hypothetical protein ABSE81_02590 [Candidatus Omnitrophota bacterium]|jgi:hypothetical protein
MEKIKNNKQLIFAILFCSFLFLYYASAAPIRINDFLNACAKEGLIVSGLQEWILSILGVIYSFFTVSVIVGIFAYWFRKFNLFFYLAFGFLGRFALPVILFLPFLKGGFSFSELTDYWIAASPLNKFSLISHIAATFIGAYCGYSYAKRSDFGDIRDEVNFTLWGISKRLWVLIAIATYSVFKFLLDFSIIQIYDATKFLTTRQFWLDSLIAMFTGDEGKGLLKIITRVFGLVMIWAIIIVAFYYAIEAIKNKNAKYRKLKIIGILIILPILILVIPIIRNRTWFFF